MHMCVTDVCVLVAMQPTSTPSSVDRLADDDQVAQAAATMGPVAQVGAGFAHSVFLTSIH